MKLYDIDILILDIFFFLLPFIDNITGAFIRFGIMGEASLASPSQLIKFVLWLFFFCRLFKLTHRRIIVGFVLVLLLFCIFEFFVGILFDNSVYALLFGIMNVFKISYLILIYIYIASLIELKKVNLAILIDFFIKNGLLCTILIAVTTLLKLNYNTYGEGNFGTKGLFPSGNGISLYLGAISLLSLFRYSRERTKKNFIIAFALIIGSTIIGTKASIVFLILDMFFFFFKIIKRAKIVILLVFIFFIIKNINIFEKVFDVIIWRYKNSDSLFAFLASGRDGYISDAFKEFNTDGLLAFRIFTGLGAFLSFRLPRQDLVVDTLENDFFDIFFMYGINGIAIYLAIILVFLLLCLRYRKGDIFILGSAIFFYSAWAGHMVFNATSGILIPFVLILARYPYESKN